MISCAYLKLIEAAERYVYNPADPVRFYAFAKFRLRGAMLDFLRLRAQRGLNRCRRATYRLGAAESLICLICKETTPGAAESLTCGSCGHTHVPAESAPRVDFFSERKPMLDRHARYHEELGPEDTLGVDADQEAPVHRAELASLIDRAAAAGGVSNRHLLVLRLRYRDDLTLAEIGPHIGVLAPRVAQLHKEALTALRAGMQICGIRTLQEVL